VNHAALGKVLMMELSRRSLLIGAARRVGGRPVEHGGPADSVHLGAGISLLRIRCASAKAAQLVHAKYLSDLVLLPGVAQTRLTIGGLRIPAYETSAGAVAADDFLRD